MKNMKFYFTPGACSIGIHILLEELGLVFEAYPINLIKGEHQSAQFLDLNPKGSIPVLVLQDGTPLTDFVSIAWWLAKSNPRSGLLPSAIESEVAILDLMNYAINTVHGQGFTRIFTTEKYTSNATELTAVQDQGVAIVQRGLALLDRKLADGVVSEDHLTIADAALFYIEFWAAKTYIELPIHCRAHYQRMLQRPAVRQVLMEEGYHSTLSQSQPTETERLNAIA